MHKVQGLWGSGGSNGKKIGHEVEASFWEVAALMKGAVLTCWLSVGSGKETTTTGFPVKRYRMEVPLETTI